MVVTLRGELTIGSAAAQRAELLAALEHGEALELDGSAVTEADAAGLQLLWALARSARARRVGLAFRRGGRSRALADAIDLAGMGSAAGGRWLVEEGTDA